MDEVLSMLQRIELKIDTFRNELNARLSRPYYSLDDGWALTHLDTGQPFFVNTQDRNVTPWILMGGHWETNVDIVMSAYVKPGMFVADIGAHMGYYSVKLGSLVGPQGYLIAFEPNPQMNPYTERNMAINGIRGELKKIGLGNEKGVAHLSFTKGNHAQASLAHEGNSDYSYDVPVETADDVFADLPALDFIKLDAEGFEPMILEGAQKTLARAKNCAIMIELNMGRWERYTPLEKLPLLIGEDKIIFAVGQTGRVRRLEFAEMRPFLEGCFLTENYFLFCPPNDAAIKNIEHLIDA